MEALTLCYVDGLPKKKRRRRRRGEELHGPHCRRAFLSQIWRTDAQLSPISVTFFSFLSGKLWEIEPCQDLRLWEGAGFMQLCSAIHSGFFFMVTARCCGYMMI
jgi:hypothetical protein